MRKLFSRSHAVLYPEKSVFLAGPTPPSGSMHNGWRRAFLAQLQRQFDFDDTYLIVSPEPLDGDWNSIATQGAAEDDQIAWELQYLELCSITAFWLPTYWTAREAACFPANIGPTTRWEFGYMLQKYLQHASQRQLIVGGPDDAQGVGWARHVVERHGLRWYGLPPGQKQDLVSTDFVRAVGDALLGPRMQCKA